MQLIVAIIFVLITGPLSSHMIMKAYNIKTPYTKKTKVDEISEDLKDTKCINYRSSSSYDYESSI